MKGFIAFERMVYEVKGKRSYENVEIIGGGGVIILAEAVVEISGGPAERDGAGEHGPECEHQNDGESPELVAAAAEKGGGVGRSVLPRRDERNRGR